MTGLASVFVGSGRPLVECADLWLARGQRVVGVISDHPEVAAWCERNGVVRIDPDGDQLRFLGREPFEYLFSIINHRLMAPELLAVATRASINYHDSLLPAYAGFNATSWSILDGNDRHGITWHRMAADADSGGLYLQVEIEIDTDDTAFTLEAKCSQEAVRSFDVLAGQLIAGREVEREQVGARSFHLMSDRPPAANVLDLRAGVARLDRTVRAATFGPDDNPFGLPKLWDGRGPIWVGTASVAHATGDADGTVAEVDGDVLTVAVGGREVRFDGLLDADGRKLTGDLLRERGVVPGVVLPPLPREVADAATALDAAVRRGERWWVRRLAVRRPTRAPGLEGRADDQAAVTAPITLPAATSAALAGRSPEGRLAAWVAAVALWASTIDDAEHVDVDVDLGTVGSDVATLFARRVPLHLSTDTDVTCAQAVVAAEEELATLRRRGTFARDVVARYRELREGPGDRVLEPAAVAVVAGDADGVELADAACVLHVGTDGSAHVVRRAALDDAVVADVTGRWVAALVALLANPDAPVGKVSLLSAAERAVLDGLNDTAAPYRADRCIHELFAEQVARTPDATALVSGDASVTFAALDRRANAVARRLVAEDVGPDVLVGICIERSIEMVVGLLGILKAGGAYVPLDPVYPRERLAIMLDDSAAPVLLTRRQLAERLPTGERSVLIIDDFDDQEADPPDPAPAVTPDHLAYTIFTSGSTGRPKGVMVQHGNVSNFFTGMDGAVDTEPGVLLAVTSISFDISVLELFWALTRGFEVIVQSESDRASLGQAASATAARRMGFGLFYFAADASDAAGAYKVLLDGARFADANGFDAVWTPERHFHPFGGLYPNPAITSAALATITSRIQIRAGSVVLPLHDPIRVAEEWAVVDNLSGGRVGLSFASGWHANDFVFQPDDFADRRNVMVRHIDSVRRLWRGETVRVRNGEGVEVDIATLPRPIQAEPPMWIASAGSADTFRAAGSLGANVLTNMLGQTVDELRDKIGAYREARRAAGFVGDGIVSVMLHTFIGQDTDEVRRIVKGPFCNYLATSFDLVKAAPWSFPAFRQPSREAAADSSLDPDSFTPDDVAALMDFAFERYFDTAGLFGTPSKAMGLVEQLRGIGVDELACLVDFGVAADTVLTHLDDLAELMRLAQSATVDPAPAAIAEEDAGGVVDQILRRGVTHLQCTPSMVRMLLADPRAAEALGRLERLLVGGEALPADLAEQVAPLVGGRMINMYGPTETTVWSTTAPVVAGEPLTIGRPIANTVVRVVDSRRRLVPVGTPGELLIGGAGVVRGYLGRSDLTAERFVDDPFAEGRRLYRTGDLVRVRDDGRIEFLGRIDHQVKVNGYRIELGEIEAVLGRHPAVHEAVVVARDAPGGGSQLAAYVVPSARPDSEVGTDVVHQWQRLWDETYAQSARDDNDESVVRGAADARFNIAGWNSTATGQPIPAEEMAEWVDRTVDRLVGLAPTNVLELGCGTGLLLFRMLPHVQHYTAVDVSEHALAQIKAELTDDERRKVDLLQGPADGVSLPAGSVDLVVVNSVAQYFPDLAYLERVVERAVACVADGGAVWLGDLRHLALLDAFQAEVQLTQAPADLPAADLRSRLRTRVEREGELLVDPLLFDVLAARIPRIAGIDVQLKRGAALNEMTRFRYDVVLRVGPTPVPAADVTAVPAPAALADVAGLLDGRAVRVTGLPNARLDSALALAASIDGATTGDVAGLRAGRRGGGVDPAALLGLDDRYDVELRWNDDDIATFDATFRPRGTGSPERPPQPVHGAPPALANAPAQATPTALDLGDLRSHLRAHLPEYMVPAAFVVMTALPLTPNGKIDRKALPTGQAQVPVQRAEYAAPTNDLEGTIVRIWQDLLGIDQVGLDDNIFDLGANSLLTVQANNRLSQLLERRISLVSMFQHPTVRTLAAHLGVAADTGEQAVSAADRGRSRAEARRMARQGRRP